MRKSLSILILLIAGTLSLAEAHAAPSEWAEARVAPADDQPVTRAELQLALRDLWVGHIFWARSVVIASHYDDSAAAEAAEAEVVDNARALADAIIPFYGQEAADQLFDLLAGHYGAIKEYMQAAFDEDVAGKKSASTNLVANAEQIADFLDAANPNLPKNAVLPLLTAHGGHHIQQIDAAHAEDFGREAQTWSAMVAHIYTIADALADALAKEFPEIVRG